MGATRKRKDQDQAEWNVIFPFVDVELVSGHKITVKQWDIDKGAVLMGRVISMLQKLQGITGEVELDELLNLARDECVDIVCATIDWTRDELNARVSFEDFLSLLQAVIDTSLVRKDGGGVLPKVVGLAGALGPLAKLAGPSGLQAPSTSSSEPDTPSPN